MLPLCKFISWDILTLLCSYVILYIIHFPSPPTQSLLRSCPKAVGLLNIALCHGLCCVVFVMNCLHFLGSSTHTILVDCVTSSDALCWLFVMNNTHFPSLKLFSFILFFCFLQQTPLIFCHRPHCHNLWCSVLTTPLLLLQKSSQPIEKRHSSQISDFKRFQVLNRVFHFHSYLRHRIFIWHTIFGQMNSIYFAIFVENE